MSIRWETPYRAAGKRLYIGIDPGASGGIAMLDAQGRVVALEKMPATDRDILDVLAQATELEWTPTAVLEFVRSSPQMGVVSAFTFGCGWGALRMALCASQIPFDEVTPAKWQRALSCLTHGDKNVSKRRAQELFPGQKITHATADALLLAEYGRRNAVS